MHKITMFASVISFFVFATPAFAQDEDTAPAAEPSKTEESSRVETGTEPLGLSLDLGVISTYVFRGLNVFADDSMMDQKAFLAPGVTYSMLDGALQIGYWGAYQITGDNIGGKIDGAAGAENDLLITYNHELVENLSLSAGAIIYLYPLADSKVAGTDLPTVLEPIVGLSFSSVVDLSLNISYFFAVQKAIESWRYLYINPTVGKAFELSDQWALEASAGFGYKAAADFDSNVLDALVSVALPINLSFMVVKPSVSAAWTNIEGLDIGDELAVFGGVNVSTEL